MPNTTTPTATGRLVSLDVFRGITIAGMVLVNNPGSWEHIYWPLEHAQWHGWTPTDLVFPFFLFIVGVAITLAFGSRVESGRSARDLYLKVIKRTGIIFAIGLFLNGFPYFGLSELRIPGVLQRIAVCYFLASIIFLTTKIRTQVAITIALLLGYWLLVKFIPAPGFVAGDLTKEGSLPSFIDRVVFG
jgi:predicted acyltransferase